MIDENESLYTIGIVSKIIDEHPETLRVWERNKLICPARINNQRRYCNNDIKKLKFIKHLIDEKGLNLAGVREIINMYPCWHTKSCKGAINLNNSIPINYSKPCWKIQGGFCFKPQDKAEMCSTCKIYKKNFSKE